jgi:hypothetical protein
LATGSPLFTATETMAASPVQSKPFAQQATLTASNEIGKSLLGSVVALSSDRKTALIGGPATAQATGPRGCSRGHVRPSGSRSAVPAIRAESIEGPPKARVCYWDT